MPVHDLSGDDAALIAEIRACALCPDLPLGPKPIFQLGRQARVLIVGQAPGRLTHAAGLPFDDVSGDRLRDWMGIDRATFYDPALIAALPMGLCYPGTGKGGDLPPRPACAAHWRHRLLDWLAGVRLTLVIGRYARDWHLPDEAKQPVTATVARWRDFAPMGIMPMPHPSPRNNRWLRLNPWFETELVPALRRQVAAALDR